MENALPEPEVGSPCIKDCRVDSAGYCMGCSRSLDEIASWSMLSNDQKLLVIAACKARQRKARRS